MNSGLLINILLAAAAVAAVVVVVAAAADEAAAWMAVLTVVEPKYCKIHQIKFNHINSSNHIAHGCNCTVKKIQN